MEAQWYVQCVPSHLIWSAKCIIVRDDVWLVMQRLGSIVVRVGMDVPTSSEFALQVDDHAHYHGTVKEGIFGDSARQLLAEFKKGSAIKETYQQSDGAPVERSISLDGFDAAYNTAVRQLSAGFGSDQQ